MQRNISGVYFRYLNPDTNETENWCFEDMPEEKQREIMDKQTENVEWIKSLALIMSKKLKEVCDLCDIVSD